MNFINCPLCSGGEKISPEAADRLAGMIYNSMQGWSTDDPLYIELWNIRNTILNRAQREPWRDESATFPICPTPAKRKYSNLAHIAPFAAKWRQHPYECECGYWHLSKQSSAQHRAKIEPSVASADEFDTIVIDPLLL